MRIDGDRDDMFGFDENFRLALGVVGGCVLVLGLIMVVLSVDSVPVRLGLVLLVLPAPALPIALAVKRKQRPHRRWRRRLRESSQKPAWLLAALLLAADAWILFLHDGSTAGRCGVGSFLYATAWTVGIWAYSRETAGDEEQV